MRKGRTILTEPLSVLLVDTLRWNTRAGSVSFSLSDDSSAMDAPTPAGDVCSGGSSGSGRAFFFEFSLVAIFLPPIRVCRSLITDAFIHYCRLTLSTRETWLFIARFQSSCTNSFSFFISPTLLVYYLLNLWRHSNRMYPSILLYAYIDEEMSDIISEQCRMANEYIERQYVGFRWIAPPKCVSL